MTNKFRVLVTGSRHRTSNELTKRLESLYKEHGDNLFLVVGDADGIDKQVRDWADRRSVNIIVFWANWKKYGKRAGPIRNQAMVDHGTDLCLAYPLPSSRGTYDCIKRAVAAKIRTEVYEIGNKVRIAYP